MVKRIIYPPVWLLLGLISIFALNELYPMIRFTSLIFQVLGGVVIVVGLLLLVTANGLFVRAGTDVIPFRDVSSLVTTGIYRFTRNPMYLGMFMMLFGVAFLLGSIGALIPMPVFVLIIRNNFVLGEERFLEAVFGHSYLAYKSEVRRWI